jgi:hypothetical protein
MSSLNIHPYHIIIIIIITISFAPINLKMALVSPLSFWLF